MMNEEKIRKYLDGELTELETFEFEKEISDSQELRERIDAYKNTLGSFRKIKNIKTDDSYFINLLPEFRKRISKDREPALKPSFAFAGIIIFIVTFLMIFIFNSDNKIELSNSLQEIETETLSSFLNNYGLEDPSWQIPNDMPEEYDSVFNEMIVDELDINGYSGEYVTDVTIDEFYNIIGRLSDDEVEGIYSSLLITENY